MPLPASNDAPWTAIRGDLLYCVDDPARAGTERALVHVPDGLVVARGGRIVSVGPAAERPADLPADLQVAHYPGCLVVPINGSLTAPGRGESRLLNSASPGSG